METNSGHVRIYELQSDNSWSKLGDDIDGEAASDQSGYSVSLSSDGSVVAIGAIRNAGGETNSGHVRIYELQSDNSWSKLGDDIDGEAADDQSGYSCLFIFRRHKSSYWSNRYNDGWNGIQVLLVQLLWSCPYL